MRRKETEGVGMERNNREGKEGSEGRRMDGNVRESKRVEEKGMGGKRGKEGTR